MSDRSPEATLLALRGSIDNIDAALIHMLAERFRCTQQVGELKAEHGMPASDPDREVRQIARLRSLAEDAHLDPEGGEQAGAGLGLRYATSIGPIRFDVGYPVSGDTGDGVQFYLGIGQAF